MRTIFKGATLIDGRGGEPVNNCFFAVEKECFSLIGKEPEYCKLPDDLVIDCTEKFIIPGLIDCHIHMDLHGFGDTYKENLVEDKLRTLRAAKEMKATLQAGFTTVRNAGSVNHIDFAVKKGIQEGFISGPHIYTSGKIISMTCSGTEYFDGMYRIADGKDECRKAAREQLKYGADFLKVMATGAVMNPGGVPGAVQLDKSEIQAVLKEGLKLGKPTAAHAHAAEGILNAVSAGVWTIEHGTMADNDAIKAMADQGTFLVPTMVLHDFFEDQAENIPAFILEKSRQMQNDYISIVKNALDAGVKVALGTDAGTNYNHHGRNAEEIVYLVEHGIMTPLEAITAATRTASEAIMADSEIGTIETGKMADFVILNSNPLSNIRVLIDHKNFHDVYKGGNKL
jgi:imidazolonepropionase-like amidohydrolase